MKKRTLYPLVIFLTFFASCSKEGNPSLTSKVWKRASVDNNPSSNPKQATIIYYAYRTCENDDRFRFSTDENYMISTGSDKCSDTDRDTVMNYSFDAISKVLIIGGVQYNFIGITKGQLKYSAVLPQVSGYNYMIYLFE